MLISEAKVMLISEAKDVLISEGFEQFERMDPLGTAKFRYHFFRRENMFVTLEEAICDGLSGLVSKIRFSGLIENTPELRAQWPKVLVGVVPRYWESISWISSVMVPIYHSNISCLRDAIVFLKKQSFVVPTQEVIYWNGNLLQLVSLVS